MGVRQLVKWGIKSVGGLLLNLSLLTVWVDHLHIAAEFAIGINWILISILGYGFTDKVVFSSLESPDGWKENGLQYLKMQVIMASSKAVNYVIYVALIWVGIDYRISWTIGAVVVFVYTFTGNRKIWS